MNNEDKKKQLIARLLEEAHNNQEPNTLNYAVPSIFSKKLASMALIREDIIYVKDAFARLKDYKTPEAERNEIVELSLFFGAISQYGRCFNSNEGKHSKLEPNDVFTQNDAALKETHEKLMELRNGYVSHRDDTEYEQAVVIMQIPVNGGEDQMSFHVKSAKTVNLSVEEIESFILLCDFLLPKIQEKIQANTEKTRDGFIKNLSPDHINMLRI